MKFEIDVTDIDAGTVIEESQCELIIGFRRDVDRYEYSFKLLQLAGYLAKLLRKSGRVLTVVTQAGSILVLSHEQASKYNARTFQLGLRRSRRSFRRLEAVDISQLSEEARHAHFESMAAQSRILTLISRKAVDTELVPAKKLTPMR